MEHPPHQDDMSGMEEVLLRVARDATERRYGKYRGWVVDNADPQQLGRLRVHVPAVLGEDESGWALPCLPFGGGDGYGWFAIPDVGAQVWVEFEEGDLNHMIWVGTFWRDAAEVPAKGQIDTPTTRLFATPAGHVLQFNDAPGEEQITLSHTSGTQLHMAADGSVTLSVSEIGKLTLDVEKRRVRLEEDSGNSLTMDTNGTTLQDPDGNKIELGPAGIKVEARKVLVQSPQVLLGDANGELLLKGQSFIDLFLKHTHLGPAGPPVPALAPLALSCLSKKVKTS
jgi:hypothetical protein